LWTKICCSFFSDFDENDPIFSEGESSSSNTGYDSSQSEEGSSISSNSPDNSIESASALTVKKQEVEIKNDQNNVCPTLPQFGGILPLIQPDMFRAFQFIPPVQKRQIGALSSPVTNESSQGLSDSVLAKRTKREQRLMKNRE
jgi:hypothetical protein